MADECQHRHHHLDEHTVLSLTALTQFQVGEIAFRDMEAGVTQDNHRCFEWSNQPLKGLICNIGCGTLPRDG